MGSDCILRSKVRPIGRKNSRSWGKGRIVRIQKFSRKGNLINPRNLYLYNGRLITLAGSSADRTIEINSCCDDG